MVLIMNKNDIKLILIVMFIVIISFVIIFINRGKGETATVYYEDKIIKKIDLSTDGEYTVSGYLGDVVLEVKDNRIRVKEENSNNHICSKEGYISDKGSSLICLPNKIIVKIENDKEIDEVAY